MAEPRHRSIQPWWSYGAQLSGVPLDPRRHPHRPGQPRPLRPIHPARHHRAGRVVLGRPALVQPARRQRRAPASSSRTHCRPRPAPSSPPPLRPARLQLARRSRRDQCRPGSGRSPRGPGAPTCSCSHAPSGITPFPIDRAAQDRTGRRHPRPADIPGPPTSQARDGGGVIESPVSCGTRVRGWCRAAEPPRAPHADRVGRGVSTSPSGNPPLTNFSSSDAASSTAGRADRLPL